METLHIPLELHVHMFPVQPSFDVPGGSPPETEPKSARRSDNVGKFGSNNGILVVYDEVGDPLVVPIKELMRCGIMYDGAYRMLLEAGFEHASVYVPHSNDGGVWVMKMWPAAFARATA